MKMRLVFASVLLIAAQSVFADSNVIEKPLIAAALDTFNQQAAQIRSDMQPNGRYQYISARDKETVEARLGDIQRLLQSHTSAADLNAQDKVKMLNAQEEVNARLRHNDENRLVCEHKPPLGSNIPVTTCLTYRETVVQRERAQKTMVDIRSKNGDIPNKESH